ncbi:SPOR domain-containing protein [Paenibacillus piri]|nr:SPOR domain-containing protein [Paenibacillus piri]
MNNAKMTFRFDHGKNKGSERIVKEDKVIPLHNGEYKVIKSEDAKPRLAEEETRYFTTVQRFKDPKQPEPGTFIDAQPLNQYTHDFGGWQSSFDTETQRIEKLIRESSKETRNLETGYHDRPDGSGSYQPYEEPLEPIRDHHWYVPEDTTAYVSRSSNYSWLKVAASVAGAVVTGIAFGFFVLSMFSGDSQDSKGSAGLPAAGSNAAATVTGAANGAEAAKAPQINGVQPNGQAAAPASASVSGGASAVVTAVNIPGKTVSFLQSGVFSTSQAADAAQTELKKKGLAAVSDAGDKYPVYVGITLTRDEALGLAQQFQQKKTDVIVKNIELPALSKIKWSAKPSDNLASYLAQGDKLLQAIAPVTLAHLTESQPTALDAASLQSVKTSHQSWTALTAGVNEGLADDARAAVQKMGTAMNTAVSTMEEYKKNPSVSYMWQTQNALMQYVLAQKELRKAVAAQ